MAIDVQRIKAICFDVDGTLSDTDDLWAARLANILRPLSFMFPEREVKPFARWSIMATESPANLFYHLLDRFDLDDDVARLYNFAARHGMEKRNARFWLVPLVKTALTRLQPHYPLAVVSARGHSTFDFLQQFELESLFSTIVVADTCRYTKPYPDPVLWAAEKMGVSAAECLMVGDTVVDIKSGRTAGAQTVGVLCGFGEEKELRRAGADLILQSTADLVGVILDRTLVSD